MNYLEIAGERIRADEGKVAHAYQDSEGYWTIGIGRLIDKRKGGGLSEDEITFLFENDLDRAVEDARAIVPKFDVLSEVRKAVLVSMAFQLGRTTMSGFKQFLKAVDESRFDDAAREMVNSLWAQQTSDRVLRLARWMKEGNTP